jgi:hypothetical protein
LTWINGRAGGADRTVNATGSDCGRIANGLGRSADTVEMPTEAASLANELVQGNERSKTEPGDSKEDNTKINGLHISITARSQDGSR